MYIIYNTQLELYSDIYMGSNIHVTTTVVIKTGQSHCNHFFHLNFYCIPDVNIVQEHEKKSCHYNTCTYILYSSLQWIANEYPRGATSRIYQIRSTSPSDMYEMCGWFGSGLLSPFPLPRLYQKLFLYLEYYVVSSGCHNL